MLTASDDVRRLNPDLFDDQGQVKKSRRSAPQDPEHPVNFDSDTERRAWDYVSTYYPSPLNHLIKLRYHPATFRMTGGKYTPDIEFTFWNVESGQQERWYLEVKPNGDWNTHGSSRSSLRALKQAAAEYADYGRFFVLYPNKAGGGWTREEITT